MEHPPSPPATQITEMQGSSSNLRVEVTVLRAYNLPHIKRWLRTKRRFFVTVTHQAVTMKSASVKIVGQTAEWNEKLDAFFLQPSSQLMLRLYAKRFLYRDILIGTHEIVPPVGSTSHISFDLGEGNHRQAGRSTQPVVLHLKVTVSANSTSTSSSLADATNPNAAKVDNSPTERESKPPMAHTPKTAASIEPQPSPMDPLPVEINPSRSPPADARVETSPIGGALYGPGEATKTTKTVETAKIGEVVMGAHRSGPSTSSITTENETTIDDIIKTVERFRILSIGRSGVGKSSLINCVFGIKAAHVEDHKPGEADIQQEFVSPENQYFVLHDSKGFEPGDLSNFETVRKFIQQRSRPEVPLSERIHGLWLCTETPTAGGRIFETGDEKLLQFAYKNQVPIVIVFTQYDRLVRTKAAELSEEHPRIDPTRLRDWSVEEAGKAFEICLQSLQRTVDYLKIPMPRYATVSVRPGHKEDVSSLVKVTRDIVKERVKGDAWMLWAIAQRASLPVKIDACVTKGISYYRRALTASGGTLELGQLLLRDCLRKVHEDIITCWNFKGEILNSPEFQQLMLRLVQDVYTQPNVSILPNVDVISQFVTLVTAASAPIAPPVAILGLTYLFVQWLSTTVLENVPSVQRLLIAYTVDLISVLRELFDITLRPELALTTTWTELQEAFETYERSFSRQRIHNSISSETPRGEQMLTADGISRKVRELLQVQL
ncbi:hypothetical protein BJY52DRAFT_74397 [Lactarius psammicola]|nr:hypothetical protein BJY52DRAFT_74397 [Lactarius psammicola]